MAHDVFISHSSADKPTADATVATLEAHGIRCWVAPRDVVPGVQWADSIVRAITGCQLMVLVFSSDTNDSDHIVREVELAAHHRKPIIPLRVENVAPCPTLDYYIAGTHWLDAIDPPLEEHLERLSAVVKDLLEQHRATAPTPSGSATGPDAVVPASTATQPDAVAPAAAPVPTAAVAVLSRPAPPPVLPPMPVPSAPAGPPAPPAPRRPRWVRYAVIGAALVLTAGLAVGIPVALTRDRGEEAAAVAPSAAPSDAPEQTSPSPNPSPSETPVTATVGNPRGLHQVGVTAGEVRLAWHAARSGAEVDHFIVLRDGEKVGRADEGSFADRTVAPSHTYVYRVVAVGVDGSRASSGEITVTTEAAPAPAPPPETSGPPASSCDGIELPSGECIPWNS